MRRLALKLQVGALASAYRVFITDVQVLKGTFVSATAAQILTDDANYLIAQCVQPHRVAS